MIAEQSLTRRKALNIVMLSLTGSQRRAFQPKIESWFPWPCDW